MTHKDPMYDVVIGRLEECIELLSEAQRSDSDDAREAVVDAWRILAGDLFHPYSRWEDQQKSLHDYLPKVWAWCVVQIEREARPYPYCAFRTAAKAREWRDFLDLFYAYRDDVVVWEVMRVQVEPRQLSRPDERPIGMGYGDRRKTTATDPEKWERFKEVYECYRTEPNHSSFDGWWGWRTGKVSRES